MGTCIKYTVGYKYQLTEDYQCKVHISHGQDIGTQFINLKTDGALTIRRGYAWDGPSGPTFDTVNFMRGSLIHDALYQLIRLKLLPIRWRERADIELRNACLEDGMSKVRAWWVYRAVRRFAGFAVAHKKRIYTAPRETE